MIDHIWLRVSRHRREHRVLRDRRPGRRHRVAEVSPAHTMIRGAGGSISLVAGDAEPQRAHRVPRRRRRDGRRVPRRRHGGGHPSNGEPGERTEYHAGYYGAFVLDPDGNNIELVNHNR